MRKLVLLAIALAAALAAGQSGWTPRKLVGSYPNWDYWWLNVRFAAGAGDTLYCAVSRYNYSQPDPDFDLYVLDGDGDTARVERPWNGPEHQPTVEDASGRNIYIGQPLLGFAINGRYHMDAGVTDDSNCVSTTNSYNDTVYFTRLDPAGGRITWREPVFAGNPWTGRTSLARDPAGRLHCTFADDIEHLVHGVSTDQGLTWAWDTLASQRVMSHVRVAATQDTCVHIVYRTWTSGVQLNYLKLRPDGSVAVAPSVFASGTERWEPNIALDTADNLRVVYVDGSQDANSLYYTALRTGLDKGGDPAPDSELTLVPDTVIQTDGTRLAGPKVAVDARNRAHVVFEQGVYGSGGSKYVYHIREEDVQPVAEMPGPVARQGLTVVPNPVRTGARVLLPAACPTGVVRVTLFNAAGRAVRSGIERTGNGRLALDRRGLEAGSYFLTIETPQWTGRVKVLVVD